MKKILKILSPILFLLFFSNYVSAYFIENSTWGSSLYPVRYSALAYGDIDNDGDLDLILTGCKTSGARSCNSGVVAKVYVNNGSSLVENSTWQNNISAVGRSSVSLGDIDNDGDLDLIASGTQDGTNGYDTKIYINNGSAFVEDSVWEQNVIGAKVVSGFVAWGDVNNDGRLDLAMTGDMVSGYDGIFINNGTTLIRNSTWSQNLVAVWRSTLAWVDVDDDNLLDLIIIGYDSGKVYINNGTSLVEDSTWQQTIGGRDHVSLALGDIDLDGDFDLFISDESPCRADVYFNTGTTFARNSSWETDLYRVFWGGSVFGDYNNNGLPDLIYDGWCGSGEQFRIYNNTGTTFEADTNAYSNITIKQEGSINFIDIDNDNNGDLTISGGSTGIGVRSKVYINTISKNNTLPNPPTNFTASYLNNQLTLIWDNASDNETPALGLYYNLKVGNSSNKNSIVSGIYGGCSGGSDQSGTTMGYFGNMMQRKSITLNVDLDANQTVYWAVQTIDTGLKAGNWPAEQNYTVPIDTTTPVITLNAPINNFNTSNPVISFNATVYDDINLTNVSLFGNWSGSLTLNETNSSGINDTDYIFIKNISSYGDGVYSWLIEAKDASNNSINSSLRIFRIDTTYPNITFALNGTTLNNSYFVFNFSVAEVNPKTTDFCWYNITNSSSQLYYKLLNLSDFTQNSSTYTYNRTLTAIANNDYNVTINCTDPLNQSTQTAYSFTLNDTTMPGITNISASSSGTTTVTVTLSVTTDEAANCRYSTSNVNYSSMSAMSTGNLSHSVSNQYTSDTSGTYYARCNDTAGNVMNYSNSTNYNADVQEPQVSSGGGGSGLTTAPTPKYYATHFWSSISEDSPADFKIDEEKISMTKIKISVANEVINAEITVTKLDKKPAAIKELDKVYQYLEIEKKNINDSDIKNAVIEFKVEKEWLLNNSADENDVILNRYTASWEELTTSKISSDEKYVYYKATTPSFSYFAVAVKEKIVEEAEEEELEEEDILPPEEVIEEEEEFAEEGPIEEKKSKDGIWFLISALIVVGIIVYVYVKKKKLQL